ncbi:cyanophycinase [Streptomyces sp. NPDC005047]
MHVPLGPQRRSLVASGAALALTLTMAPAVQAAAQGPGPREGSLVLIGGALKADNTQIYGEIIARAGGARARIGVITAASVPKSQDPNASDPDSCSNSVCNGAYYAGLFEKHGAADAEWVPIDLDHVANADADEVVAQVNSMTGFFFGGGDQYRYLTTLMHGERHTDSKVLAAIRAKLAAGAVVAGSSAGAQIASGLDMVSGGESYEALKDGSAPGYFEDPTQLGYIPDGGFGFLRSGLIDTHTGAYGREGRALRLAADTGHDRVYALDENTALVVDHAGTRQEALTVLGPQGIGVIDLRDARSRTAEGGWTLRQARYAYLTDGDRYDPRRWLPLPAPGKRPLKARGGQPVAHNGDVFYSMANPDGSPYSFRTTARALAATRAQTATTATTWEERPRFAVTFAKKRGFSAWSAHGSSGLTLTGMHIAVTPCDSE